MEPLTSCQYSDNSDAHPSSAFAKRRVDTSSANVHPCTFADGEFLLCKNVAIAWNHGHPCPF